MTESPDAAVPDTPPPVVSDAALDASIDASPEPVAQPDEPELPLLTVGDGLPPVVEEAQALDRTFAAFSAGRGPVAIDAERASGYRYSQRAYLLQLRREGAGSALIDPVPFGPVPNRLLAPLAEALAGAEWVIHAASQDLPCLAELGLRPTRLFDTELAGRLLNYPRVGLAVLVEELLGYRMRKEHSAVDWSKRPLPESWLQYAALDVEVLIELRDVLAAQLEATGKAQWAAEEFEAWATRSSPAPRTDPWRRTSGIHRVRGRRALAMVRGLWQLRDDLARSRDVTTNRILGDAAIIEAAQVSPQSRSSLAQLPGFANRGAQRYIRQFYAAIEAARQLPETALPPVSVAHDEPPPPRVWRDKYPEASARLNVCREAVSALAQEHDLPQENLVPPAAVRRIAWSPPSPLTEERVADELAAAGARRWQIALSAAPLAKALLTLPPV
jgi:ribonuclease D